MAIITLTSDYGLLDYRVAAIKGSLYSELPTQVIVDIAHDIPAYDLLKTAHIVRNAYKYFPSGSIHMICVDSFYHKERKNIVAKVDGHYFICADNGLLSLIFKDIKPEKIFEITLGNRFDDKVNFTATDLFTPVAAHLANGGVPEIVGRETEVLVESRIQRAVYNESEKMIVGEIIYIDNFGNAISNIGKRFFTESQGAHTRFDLRFRNFVTSTIYTSYTDIVKNWKQEPETHGKTAAIFNENDLLEITIYKGSKDNGASSLFGISPGERVFIEFSK